MDCLKAHELEPENSAYIKRICDIYRIKSDVENACKFGLLYYQAAKGEQVLPLKEITRAVWISDQAAPMSVSATVNEERIAEIEADNGKNGPPLQQLFGLRVR